VPDAPQDIFYRRIKIEKKNRKENLNQRQSFEIDTNRLPLQSPATPGAPFLASFARSGECHHT
jgi:hypothetical protein